MVTRNDCLEIFNASIRGTPISFTEKLIPMLSDYLTENNIENSDKMINLVIQNPHLIQQAMPELINYYCRKFNIFLLQKKISNGIFDEQQTILYYE